MDAIGPRMKMNPPVRLRVGGPWRGAAGGARAMARVDMVASDHAPHTAAEKLGGDIWSAHAGAVGVETSVAVLLTRAVAAGRLVAGAVRGGDLGRAGARLGLARQGPAGRSARTRT